ncbi:hypothetical protein Cni_G12731 [Canna indica]|uniref:Uncharacterized protein n=1 Tax=Canna indica TaxID=4628 RepID=A0AAQ3KAF1_9LILI|nr:hypothetical protein Cni_G12731 [Canna indica]
MRRGRKSTLLANLFGFRRSAHGKKREEEGEARPPWQRRIRPSCDDEDDGGYWYAEPDIDSKAKKYIEKSSQLSTRTVTGRSRCLLSVKAQLFPGVFPALCSRRICNAAQDSPETHLGRPLALSPYPPPSLPRVPTPRLSIPGFDGISCSIGLYVLDHDGPDRCETDSDVLRGYKEFRS